MNGIVMIRTLITYLCILTYLVNGRRKLGYEIPGPRTLGDRIAIIGAGASGIHMALSLKQRGFKDVTILEKTKWLGGKSWTINHRGAANEMGTVYLQPDYNDTIVPLVNKYARGDLVDLPPASIWFNKNGGGSDGTKFKEPALDFAQYVFKFGAEHLKSNDKKVIGKAFFDAINKYISEHRRILGDYDGEIMPEPDQMKKAELHKTFAAFLDGKGIGILRPLFYASHAVQGYGRLDKIPALYGLMWNTPKMMRSLQNRVSGKDGKSGLYMLKNGFSKLWKTIVKRERLNIKYNVRIIRVYRTKSIFGHHHIWIKNQVGRNGAKKLDHYDFVIWSPEMKESLRYWNTYPAERELFSKTKPTWFTTSLVDTLNVTRGPRPIDYFIDNVNGKLDTVWAQRDTYAAVRNFPADEYMAGMTPSGDDNSPVRTTIVYQMSDDCPSRIQLYRNLRRSLKSLGATYVNVLKMKTWRYFPRYSTDALSDGALWKILKLQGRYGMWYIGSSVCFESVKSVVEYNELILKNYRTPYF